MRTLVFGRPFVLCLPVLLACGDHRLLNGSGLAADAARDGASSSNDASAHGDDSGGVVDAGPPPTVMISFPANGITVGSVMGSVSVSFETTNFILVAPGDPSCLDASDLCGHVHLIVDGPSCSPPGQAYNDDGESSPIDAILTSCPAVGGSHTAVVELHHNDHSPVIVAGSVVSASVTFTAI